MAKKSSPKKSSSKKKSAKKSSPKKSTLKKTVYVKFDQSLGIEKYSFQNLKDLSVYYDISNRGKMKNSAALYKGLTEAFKAGSPKKNPKLSGKKSKVFDSTLGADAYTLTQLKAFAKGIDLGKRSVLKSKTDYFNALKNAYTTTSPRKLAQKLIKNEEFVFELGEDSYTKDELYKLAKGYGFAAKRSMNKGELWTLLVLGGQVGNGAVRSKRKAKDSFPNLDVKALKKMAIEAGHTGVYTMNRSALVKLLSPKKKKAQ